MRVHCYQTGPTFATEVDYWKSQAKKFCNFCKCWIADNKPSIEFHEGGSRHKENVAKRISEISKKSRKEHQQMLKIDDEMKKMEEAALKAYLKDVEAEADYSSKLLKEKAEAAKNEDPQHLEKKVEKASPPPPTPQEAPEKQEETISQPVWYEAKSTEGHIYYWNIETGESSWEEPSERFLSLEDQAKAEKLEKKKKAAEERRLEEEEKQRNEEQRACLEREKMKKLRKPEEKEVPSFSLPFIGPSVRVDPYGSWKMVEKKEIKPVDLQLPQQEYIAIKVPVLKSEPRQKKFKEKTFTSLANDDDDNSDFGGGFKKRKALPGAKRNMRQRLDDD